MALKLSPVQEQIVHHEDGALLVVAGPGSGKTRVLTERVRRLLQENSGHFRILALTFTNKAANEMRERLEDCSAVSERTFIGTLHSFCVEVLANRGAPVGIEGLPTIFESFQDRRHVLTQAVMESLELRSALRCAGDAKEQSKLITRWLEAIGEAKNNLLFPEMIEEPMLRRAYEEYNAGLRRSGAVDFDDLLLLTYQLFQERPKIADFYRRQYRYICVDEAQDLNEAQYMVLKSLCGPDYRNVMMVGDPKQAIFVWNGADPKYLDLFERDFNATKIAMNDNFRSSQAVVSAAVALAREYEVEGHLPIPGSLQLIVGRNEQEEATMVLDVIGSLLQSGHPDIEGPITLERCAVLGRTRYVFNALEKELGRRQWPYYKQLSSRQESESDLLIDFELCMRVLINPRDRLHFRMLLTRWNLTNRGDVEAPTDDGVTLIRNLGNYATLAHHKAVLEAIDALEWSNKGCQFLRALSSLDQFAETLESPEARALVMEDTRAWRKHWDFFLRNQPGGHLSLALFLSQVALGTTQQPKQEGLALLTVHSAKGLEFDVVFIMGMAEGVFPDYRATGRSLEEEQRNAFVAVTRSKRLLYLSYSRTRLMPWGDTKAQAPSRYLRTIELV